MAGEPQIQIERLNGSYIRIHTADRGIVEDLYDFFTYAEPDYQPSKWNKWDGTQRLYKKRDKTLPYGCLKMLLALCKDRDWSFELDKRFKEDINSINMKDLKEWAAGLELRSKGEPITPHDYQLDIVHDAIKFSRLTALAATSAGKSLAIYMLVRFYEMLAADDGLKTLIVVPSINLVTQLYGDFEDYSTKNKWSTLSNCHQICDGSPRFSNKPVFISTWQSLKDEDASYFEQFGRIIVDECHLASGESIKTIGMNCTKAFFRVGLTGSLKKEKVHPILVQSVFGPIKQFVTAKQLIASGRATPTKVKMVHLDYSVADRQRVFGMPYADEIEFLVAHRQRNEVIKNLAKGLPGNTLILFDRVEKHLDVLLEELRASGVTNKVFFNISGDVPNKTRDEIKRAIEAGNDIVLLASFGTVSTGVSIKKLHNLIFAHPFKSNIRLIQSVGRMLRLHESKDIANIFDLIDDLKFQDRSNFSMKHAFERYSIYTEEGHPVSVQRFKLEPPKETDLFAV